MRRDGAVSVATDLEDYGSSRPVGLYRPSFLNGSDYRRARWPSTGQRDHRTDDSPLADGASYNWDGQNDEAVTVSLGEGTMDDILIMSLGSSSL
jgi:hypothetical protein